MAIHTLSKQERLCGRSLTSQLFDTAGSKSLVAFPLRMVWTTGPRRADEPRAKMLISVSKRRLRHAVDRNRAKRQVREAYRLVKSAFFQDLKHLPDEQMLLVGFIWLADRPVPSAVVTSHVQRLVRQLCEKT